MKFSLLYLDSVSDVSTYGQ